MIESKAIARYVRTSPDKSRRILRQIQGKQYQEARLILEFMPYRVCKIIIKVLESAFNNLENKSDAKVDKKRVQIIEACANKGPILKRFQPRAQGRAFPIRKATCHINIKLGI